MLRLCCGTQGTRTENGSLAEALEKRRYLEKKRKSGGLRF